VGLRREEAVGVVVAVGLGEGSEGSGEGEEEGVSTVGDGEAAECVGGTITIGVGVTIRGSGEGVLQAGFGIGAIRSSLRQAESHRVGIPRSKIRTDKLIYSPFRPEKQAARLLDYRIKFGRSFSCFSVQA